MSGEVWCLRSIHFGVNEIIAQRHLVELRQLIRLAVPLVFTQLAQMGMGVVDTVMAGRLGAVNLAGVALGGVVFWPLLLLVAGGGYGAYPDGVATAWIWP